MMWKPTHPGKALAGVHHSASEDRSHRRNSTILQPGKEKGICNQAMNLKEVHRWKLKRPRVRVTCVPSPVTDMVAFTKPQRYNF